MTETLKVSAGESGVLRLFSLDMPPEQVRFLREPGALDDVLGVSGLSSEDIEIFPVSDLDELGLPGYLTEGHAIPPEQIDGDLANVAGPVMIVHSRAFGGHAATLRPADTLTPLGTFTATPTDWTAPPTPATKPEYPYAARVTRRLLTWNTRDAFSLSRTAWRSRPNDEFRTVTDSARITPNVTSATR